MLTSSSSPSPLFGAPLDQQTTALLIVMSEAEYQQPHSSGNGFVTALHQSLKGGPHIGSPKREPVVTTVPVNGHEDGSDWSAVLEDIQDLLSYTSSVLLVPWLPGMASAHIFDRLQESLSGPVQERTFLRPTVAVKRAAPFGPWNNPVNPQQQLDRYLLWYPGWADRFTCLETATQRVTVVWRREFPHPPLSPSACQTAMREAQQLLTAAVRPVAAGQPSQLHRDGCIYLDYLCTLIARACAVLDEKPLL